MKSVTPSNSMNNTEIGLIPRDWGVVPITQITREIFLGLTSKVDYVDRGGVPLIRATDIARGKLSFSVARTISLTQHKYLTKFRRAQRGDVLVSKSGSLGVCALVDDDREFSIYESIIVLQPKSNLCSKFLLCLLRDENTQARIVGEKVGSSVSHLNLEMFRNLIVQLPTLAEQEAIASALSDADSWIESLEELVAKKRHLKQAAMQQLLTGKKRLPGFDGEWEVFTLGDLVSFLSGGTPLRNNDKYWNGNIPWISASSLRCFEVWRSSKNVTKEAVAAGSKMAPIGSTLLLVRGSALHKEILSGLVIKPVCFNQDVKALVPHSRIVPIFLTLLIKGRSTELLKLVSSAGNTAGVLDTKLLKAFKLKIPKPQEQTAIADILSDMDAEITAIEAKLSKARQIKQGMMQELLTGRIRLVEP